MTKLYSAACERNAKPILQAIEPLLTQSKLVLEIGSGTGQHAVYLSHRMPHLTWQTSDRLENHASILAWIAELPTAQVKAPLELDVSTSAWPEQTYDAIFTANTCHIMSWKDVEYMFSGCANILRDGGWFLIYGPFNYQGQFTSLSNQQFDASLKAQEAHRGIREFEEMVGLASKHQFILQEDKEMPANNRLLVFKRAN